MGFKEDLTRIIKPFTVFDEKNGCYVTSPRIQVDERLRLHLEGELIKLISREFSFGLPVYTEITQRYKHLSKIFHPDKQSSHPEVVWLDKALSGNSDEKGECFKCLTLCYERLHPDNKEHIDFNQINNMDDLKTWLMSQKATAKTRLQINLYTCLIQMLDQMSTHNADRQVIKNTFLRALMLQLPVFVSGFCVLVFAEELLAVYGICFISLKLGQQLSHAESPYWKEFGQKMQELSYNATLYTSSLAAKTIEISFWLTNQSYHTGLALASTVLSPILVEKPSRPYEPKDENNQAIVPQPRKRTYSFQTTELKMVSSHLESYLELNAEQWLKPLRAGGIKRQEIKMALDLMTDVDQDESLSFVEKMHQTEKIIQSMMSKPMVYNTGKDAHRALNNAMYTLTWYLPQDQDAQEEKKEAQGIKQHF